MTTYVLHSCDPKTKVLNHFLGVFDNTEKLRRAKSWLTSPTGGYSRKELFVTEVEMNILHEYGAEI